MRATQQDAVTFFEAGDDFNLCFAGAADLHGLATNLAGAGRDVAVLLAALAVDGLHGNGQLPLDAVSHDPGHTAHRGLQLFDTLCQRAIVCS